MGYHAFEVFDGRREPTSTERLRALLSNVALGPHLHLMERGPNRRVVTQRVAAIEEEADWIACELLALVVELTAGNSRTQLAAELVEVFGLPAARAEDYSHLLLPSSIPDPLIQRFRQKR